MWSVRAFASSMTSIHFDLVSSFSKVFHALLTTAINEIFCYIFITLQDILLHIYCITIHKRYCITIQYLLLLHLLSKACCALSASSWFLSGCTKIDIYNKNHNIKLYYLLFIREKRKDIYLHDGIFFLFHLLLCLDQSARLQMDSN